MIEIIDDIAMFGGFALFLLTGQLWPWSGVFAVGLALHGANEGWY